jgi:hypothetical protein
MKRRHWKSKEKLEIVLEGLKNQCSVAECRQLNALVGHLTLELKKTELEL